MIQSSCCCVQLPAPYLRYQSIRLCRKEIIFLRILHQAGCTEDSILGVGSMCVHISDILAYSVMLVLVLLLTFVLLLVLLLLVLV